MAETTRRLGPIALAPGVEPRHALCYLFAALVSIGLFTYLTALTPYVLRVNLGLPDARHGEVSGMLQFWQEIVVLCTVGLWGAWSDRVGRRPVYVAGFLICATAYVLYPLAGTLAELTAFRLLFGLGLAAMAAMLATVLADYPSEPSRGKLTGIAFLLNGVGSVCFFVFLTRLPQVYSSAGASEVRAGQYAYFTVAAIALLAAIVMLGLRRGQPIAAPRNEGLRAIVRRGVQAGRRPRIALAYGSAFAARADMALITLFLALWTTQAAIRSGATAAEATMRVGMTVGIAQGTAVLWAPIFGWLGDRIDRLTLLLLGFALAVTGYAWIGLTSQIVAPSAIPALVMLGIGQSSTILASSVLLGQEAPAESRGAVFGVQSFVGGIGILAISAVGGVAFDGLGPQSPFLLMAAVNLLIVLWAMGLKLAERSQGAAAIAAGAVAGDIMQPRE